MSLKTIFCPPNADNCRKFIFGLDDMAGAAAVGGLFSAGSGLLGGLFSSGEGRAQRKWATQENALNRQFQHDEAELAYQRNESTRIAQNEWNSEQAQVARMKEAGINPYNALSGLSGSSVSSSGNTASAGNASGSQMMYQQAKMDWVNNIAQAGLMAAQARKLDAETNNLNSNTAGQDLQNAYDEVRNDIYNRYGADLTEADLKLKNSGVDLNNADIALKKTIEDLNSYDLKEMRPAERNLLIAKKLTEDVMPDYFNSLTNLNNTQAFCLGQKLGAEIAALFASANRDNSAAAESRSNIWLNGLLGKESQSRTALNGLLGKESQSRTILNGTLESESQSRIGINTIEERMKNLEWKKEQELYDEQWDLYKQNLKNEMTSAVWRSRRRDPSQVGAFEAGVFQLLDEARGFVGVGIGFNRSFSTSRSSSTFSGHTTSDSRVRSSSNSYSENHNWNHRTD